MLKLYVGRIDTTFEYQIIKPVVYIFILSDIRTYYFFETLVVFVNLIIFMQIA